MKTNYLHSMRIFTAMIVLFAIIIACEQYPVSAEKNLSEFYENLAEMEIDKMVDTRDARSYHAFEAEGVKWMSEDLKFNSVEGLYTWKEAKTACPDGWRLPNDNDFKKLEAYLDTKKTKIEEWNNIGWQGVDAGMHFMLLNREFCDTEYCSFWTNTGTEFSNDMAWSRDFSRTDSRVYRFYADKNEKFSVRCIQSN